MQSLRMANRNLRVNKIRPHHRWGRLPIASRSQWKVAQSRSIGTTINKQEEKARPTVKATAAVAPHQAIKRAGSRLPGTWVAMMRQARPAATAMIAAATSAISDAPSTIRSTTGQLKAPLCWKSSQAFEISVTHNARCSNQMSGTPASPSQIVVRPDCGYRRSSSIPEFPFSRFNPFRLMFSMGVRKVIVWVEQIAYPQTRHPRTQSSFDHRGGA